MDGTQNEVECKNKNLGGTSTYDKMKWMYFSLFLPLSTTKASGICTYEVIGRLRSSERRQTHQGTKDPRNNVVVSSQVGFYFVLLCCSVLFVSVLFWAIIYFIFCLMKIRLHIGEASNPENAKGYRQNETQQKPVLCSQTMRKRDKLARQKYLSNSQYVSAK